VIGLTEFTPEKPLTLVLHHRNGGEDSITVNHTYNKNQIEWFKAGSALNLMGILASTQASKNEAPKKGLLEKVATVAKALVKKVLPKAKAKKPAKKVVKKSAKKAAKKVVAEKAKRPAPKKAVKKTAKKVTAKKAMKKPAKKAAKKVAKKKR